MLLRPKDENTAVNSAPPDRLPGAGLEGYALFLDFDGTLVDIADGPELIEVPETLPGLLARLLDETGGAVALVSGRSVSALQRFLPEFDGILIGGHGAEMVVNAQTIDHALSGSDHVRRIEEACTDFAADRDGVEAELKPTGAVLHFRQAPEEEADARQLAENLCRENPNFEVHDAKMAVELRPKDVGKDIAIERLMSEDAFAGRIPVFIGDDATDEPALAWADAMGGLSIHVGDGRSVARYRLSTPSEVHELLSGWTTKEI